MKAHSTLFLLLHVSLCQYFSPFAPSLPAYNSFWNGAVGQPLSFSQPTTEKPSVFSSDFDSKGASQIYQLDTTSPRQEKVGDFNGMVPFYNPAGVSRYDWLPAKGNFMSPHSLGSFAYDLNEPRYTDLYKDYYRFFNTDLSVKNSLMQNIASYHQLNDDEKRRAMYPTTYDYFQFFDGFGRERSMRGHVVPFMRHKQKDPYEGHEEHVPYDALNHIDASQNQGNFVSQDDHENLEELGPDNSAEVAHQVFGTGPVEGEQMAGATVLSGDGAGETSPQMSSGTELSAEANAEPQGEVGSGTVLGDDNQEFVSKVFSKKKVQRKLMDLEKSEQKGVRKEKRFDRLDPYLYDSVNRMSLRDGNNLV